MAVLRSGVRFCTVCAAANPFVGEVCVTCGASLRRPGSGRVGGRRAATIARRRAVAVLPLVVILVVGLAGLGRYRAEQDRLAEWYARAAAAEAAGLYGTAAELYAEADGYRDAEERRTAAQAAYQATYVAAAAALDAGDHDEAIALLTPLARNFSGESDAMLLLEEARVAREAELRAEADTAARNGDWLAAEAALARLEAATGDPAVAAELEAVQSTRAPVVLGREDGLYLVGPTGDDERLVTGAVPATQPTWSPDRGRIAFTSPGADERMVGDLYVVNTDGTGLKKLAERVAAYRWPVWSPDGTRLAYSSFAEYDTVAEQGKIGVRMVDLATGEERNLTGDRWDYASSPTWSPDGTRLAVVSRVMVSPPQARIQLGAGEVQLIDLGSGEVRSLTGERLPEAWRVSWNPVNDWIIVLTRVWRDGYGPYPTDLHLLDAATGALTTIDGDPSAVATAYWSPDGRRFAYVDEEGKVLRLGSPGGRTGWVRLLHPVSEWLTWSPDGSALIAVAPDAWTPSILLRFDGPVTTQQAVDLHFLLDWYATAPPQWAARNPAAVTDAASPGGTAHDSEVVRRRARVGGRTVVPAGAAGSAARGGSDDRGDRSRSGSLGSLVVHPTVSCAAYAGLEVPR